MWKDAYLESRVLSADPIELIHILYEHTLNQVKESRRHLAAGDITGRSTAISKAIAAFGELEGALDLQNGGSIGKNLAELYQYMQRRLLEANVKKEDGLLAEVESLLTTLSEAWSAIRPQAQAVMPVATVASMPEWGGGIPTESYVESGSRAWSA